MDSHQQTPAAGFKDPFEQIASEPWQQLDIDDTAAADGPLRVSELVPESVSKDNEDDTLVTSSDPAACDFLLAALMFQDQRTLQQQESRKQEILQEKEQPSSLNTSDRVQAVEVAVGIAVAAIAGQALPFVKGWYQGRAVCSVTLLKHRGEIGFRVKIAGLRQV